MQNRRTLHQPFFPLPSSTPPPSSSPPVPKYPFSTNPQQPFFPNYPYPPPPPPSTPKVPTFPANISSLIYPNSNAHSRSHTSSHSKFLPAILFSLIAFSVITLSLAFLFHRRRRRNQNSNRLSETHKPKPASDNTTSLTSAAAPTDTSDFLYLGTIVNNGINRGHIVVEAVPVAQKLGSPELRPLPPLSRTSKRNYGNATDSDEEFYSPKAESDNATTNRSNSRRELEDEKYGFQSYDLSTPSYPDSNSGRSSSPVGSSPAKSDDETKRSRSGTPPPPPPPPLLGPMRPMTPSPPKRKPPFPSPPLSPTVDVRSRDFAPSRQNPRDSDFLWKKSRNAELLQQNSKSMEFLGRNSTNSEILGQKSRKSELVGQNPRNAEMLVQNSRDQMGVPPPPPPPPPPVGYWESRVRKPSIFAAQKPAVLNKPIESSENSDSAEKNEDTTPRPRLKPLHWDKVRASSDRAMVWDQLKSSSFQVNEEMMETLFGCSKTSNAAPKEANRQPHQQHPMIPSPRVENRVLDPKKSQNIAILLRALNVTKEEVCEALLEGNTESLGTELLETLLKMAPSKEEEIKLKEFKDESPFKLGPAEKFLKAVLDIPFAFKRVDAMLYIANFDSEVSYLKNSFETLENACEELRNSRLFLKLLEAVLKTGNRMNVGTNRGDAHAFKLDTLLKLADVKGTDGKTTLLHFVVQEIIRAEGSRLSSTKTQANTLQNDLKCKKLGLQVVAGLGTELANVKKAAAMDSEVLSSYVSKLASGIGKIADVSRLINSTSSQFNEAMSTFLKKAEDGIIRVQAQESVALSLVKEITEYFHGNSVKEEAHPLRIFMVVRDFLSVLDQVCKEVGRINEQSIASSARQFPVPVNPTLPPLFPQIMALRPESSDDESSSSS